MTIQFTTMYTQQITHYSCDVTDTRLMCSQTVVSNETGNAYTCYVNSHRP